MRALKIETEDEEKSVEREVHDEADAHHRRELQIAEQAHLTFLLVSPPLT